MSKKNENVEEKQFKVILFIIKLILLNNYRSRLIQQKKMP